MPLPLDRLSGAGAGRRHRAPHGARGGGALIEHATRFVGRARELDLDKPPGIAETIDWVSALAALGWPIWFATTRSRA